MRGQAGDPGGAGRGDRPRKCHIGEKDRVDKPLRRATELQAMHTANDKIDENLQGPGRECLAPVALP